MKKSILAFLAVLVTLAGPAYGREISQADGSSFSLKTLTEFGVDLDNPNKYGLAFSIPELLLSYDLFGYQKLSNRLKTDDPVGFLDVTLGLVQIRFANLADPDYNNDKDHYMKPGFNDSNGNTTGFFGPLYLQNLRSGILWGDWMIQLGAGGTDSFWDPWHRESTGYGSMSSSWAYLDTRVQYQRGLVPALIMDRLTKEAIDDGDDIKFDDTTNYWAYDKKTDSAATGVDELAADFTGSMIGLQYAGSSFQTMAKLSTKYSWKNMTGVGTNGVAGGLDWAFTPPNLKGFRVLGSLVSGVNQGGITPHSVSGGMKVGYDIVLPKSSVKLSSIEPYVGADVFKPFALDGKGDGPAAAEASTGVTLHWPGMNGWGYDYLQGEYGRTGNVYSGVTLAYKVFSGDVTKDTVKHSAQLTWYNDVDGGIVNDVGSELVAQWMDFANADGINKLLVTAYVDYNMSGVLGGQLVPWTKVYYDNFKLVGMKERGNNLKVDTGIRLKKAIRNTEFGITYQSKNLFGAPDSINPSTGFGALGVVKFSVLVNL